MQQLIAVWTFVNDFGQWAAIGGLAIVAYRAEMREARRVFPKKISDLPYRKPTVFLSGRHVDEDAE